MPQVEIRLAIRTDIPDMMSFDHGYTTDHVWQMDFRSENGEIGVVFREIRLPRSVRVEYPRDPLALADEWTQRNALYVAVSDGEVMGYASLMSGLAPDTAWLTDLAVVRRYRRQGIGAKLLATAKRWAVDNHLRRIILEMQSKNYPAISLAQKFGYDFCGYNDRYYSTQDITLFFAKPLDGG